MTLSQQQHKSCAAALVAHCSKKESASAPDGIEALVKQATDKLVKVIGTAPEEMMFTEEFTQCYNSAYKRNFGSLFWRPPCLKLSLKLWQDLSQ